MNSIARPLRLQDQVKAVIRTRRYSRRTEKSYWYWIRHFIRFMTWLAVERNVAAATQNQALNALVFLYGKVLEQPLGNIGDTVRTKRPPRLPAILSHGEAMAVITALRMPYRLMASLMYGAGLRVGESARLRVKDIDFSQRVMVVRSGRREGPHDHSAAAALRNTAGLDNSHPTNLLDTNNSGSDPGDPPLRASTRALQPPCSGNGCFRPQVSAAMNVGWLCDITFIPAACKRQ